RDRPSRPSYGRCRDPGPLVASAPMPTPADRAADAVERDEVLAFARALIAAPSENPGGTEDEAADVAADILSSLDLGPEIVRGEADRPSVVARLGAEDRPSLAWNGHLDTVPAGAGGRG